MFETFISGDKVVDSSIIFMFVLLGISIIAILITKLIPKKGENE